mmetsp:Transcript_6656/g.13857  ORF Transcript_6656/g.13857 Transcript_6656/m.13857 type:complete len:173 (+) Transcript_6656:717-1235(+)
MPGAQISSCKYGESNVSMFSLRHGGFSADNAFCANKTSNKLANKEGSEMVDAIMKIIGVKLKTKGDVITQSQYVRVNLVDYEHPFFSKVWHGVHVLDSNSTLLTNSARKKIQDNGGSWPSEWFKPKIIHDILDFEDLVVTVAGISSVSAVSGYAYKRYKKGVSFVEEDITCE